MKFRAIILLFAIHISQNLIAQSEKHCDSLTIYFEHDEKNPLIYSGIPDSIFNNHKGIEVKIYGYTDQLGSDEYNQKLSQQRADELASYIRSKNKNVVISICQGRGKIHTDRPAGTRIPEHRKAVVHYCLENEKVLETKPIHVAEVVTIQKEEWKTGEKIELRGLNFQPGLTKLLPQSEKILLELEQKMKENPNLKIEIQGHVCCLENNLKDGLDHATGRYDLSVGRAKKVYDYLVEKGISAERMTYKGFSNKAPRVWPENTDSDRSANRRVEILIISE